MSVMIENLLKSDQIEKYPFVKAILAAIPGIKRIGIENVSPYEFRLVIEVDNRILTPKGFYTGIPDGDAVELVQTAIDEDQVFRKFQEDRDAAYQKFKDHEMRLANEYHERVKELNDKYVDIIQRGRK